MKIHPWEEESTKYLDIRTHFSTSPFHAEEECGAQGPGLPKDLNFHMIWCLVELTGLIHAVRARCCSVSEQLPLSAAASMVS